MTNVTLSVRAANVAKRWSITLWAAQIALAGLFGLAGTMKLSMAPSELFMIGLNYAVDIPYALLLFIGVSEVAGALGVILPAFTTISSRRNGKARSRRGVEPSSVGNPSPPEGRS
jgi:uncharacterized membrane protein YphA (DoxX/SURF4 family)